MAAAPISCAFPPVNSTPAQPHWAEAEVRLLNCALERRVAEVTADLLERYEHERRISQILQRALLLSPPPSRFPSLAVESLSHVALPEAFVGGDFCDAFSLDHESVALVLGDVCGKGLVAALHVPEVKFALRAFLRENSSPARAVTRLNDSLCLSRDHGAGLPSTLAAVAVVVLNGCTGRGVCCLAGAEAPLLLRADGACASFGEPGAMLGIEAGWAYTARDFLLHPDDLLLMATDGVTEARYDGAFLGYEGLTALAARAWASRSNGPADTKAIGRAVLDGVMRFAGGPLQDDACLLLAQRLRK